MISNSVSSTGTHNPKTSALMNSINHCSGYDRPPKAWRERSVVKNNRFRPAGT